MKKIFALFNNELISYLIFGFLTTLVYLLIRAWLFSLTSQTLLSVVIANITAISFAFFTNDTIVFKQKREGWAERFIKFFTARLLTFVLDALLAFIFVTQYPDIIGQFVNHDIKMVDRTESLIAQVLIIVLNYILSKMLIFKNKQDI